jgi:dienelactone hydrolase
MLCIQSVVIRVMMMRVAPLQSGLDRSRIEEDFIATAQFMKSDELSNGKLGAVGFCFGGYIVNMLAATLLKNCKKILARRCCCNTRVLMIV